MTSDARLPLTCECGKTIQTRSFARHCTSKHHIAFVSHGKPTDSEHPPTDRQLDLTAYLRENDLRANRAHIRTIVQRYDDVDPYTKAQLNLRDAEQLPTRLHIDHIHEAQIVACAIQHTREFAPRYDHALVLLPVRRALNDVSNLTITDAGVNVAKGQAIRTFLGRYEKNAHVSLLATLMHTARGKERSIAHLARNIVDVLRETSAAMSESIRELRMDRGHVTGASRYETVAEQFDTIIERMQLDWSECVQLRSGKIYQACKR